jgi:hypothetical protein
MLYGSHFLTSGNIVKFRLLRRGFRIFADAREFGDKMISESSSKYNSGCSATDKLSDGSSACSLIRHTSVGKCLYRYVKIDFLHKVDRLKFERNVMHTSVTHHLKDDLRGYGSPGQAPPARQIQGCT